MNRQAYIAEYDHEGRETIIMRDSFWSPKLQQAFDTIAANFRLGMKPVEGWYSDEHQVECMGRINLFPPMPRQNS